MKFQYTPESFFPRTLVFVVRSVSMLCWPHQSSLIYLWSIWGKLVRKYLLFFFPSAKKCKQEKNILDIKLMKLYMFLVSSISLKVILENKVVCLRLLTIKNICLFLPFRKVSVLYPKFTEVTEFFCSDFRVLWNKLLVHSDFCQARGSELTPTLLC